MTEEKSNVAGAIGTLALGAWLVAVSIPAIDEISNAAKSIFTDYEAVELDTNQLNLGE